MPPGCGAKGCCMLIIVFLGRATDGDYVDRADDDNSSGSVLNIQPPIASPISPNLCLPHSMYLELARFFRQVRCLRNGCLPQGNAYRANCGDYSRNLFTNRPLESTVEIARRLVSMFMILERSSRPGREVPYQSDGER